MDLKAGIHGINEKLGELEEVARKLPNQNFADIIKSARARLTQAAEHPDLEHVEAKFSEPKEEPHPFPGTEGIKMD